MKHLKYKVTVGSSNTFAENYSDNYSGSGSIASLDTGSENSDKVYLFRTIKEICSFLKISYGSLYSLRSGRLKCKHYSKQHLSNIKVEKIEYDHTHYQKKIGIERESFLKELDEKYTSSIQ